ncbi:MAG: cytochrome-c oxidase, cbb3-type subunit III [Dokdonella sp.]
MSTIWSWYVIALVASNILGCVALLWWTSRPRTGDARPDDTSHVWDGDITEYNKPLPHWWINLFYLTIIYGIGYLFWYGGWGSYQGFSGWSSVGELKHDQSIEDAKLEVTYAPFKGKPIDVIARDPIGIKLGQAIFANTCATCHGSSGRGAIGFPNLRDDVWKWGNTPDDVLTAVLQGREGVMPPWGEILTSMGGDGAVAEVVKYVQSLSDPSLAADPLAVKGGALYAGVCIACHGVDGKGNQALGASNLTDAYSLYGNSTEQITETIIKGRHGVMPAQGPILGDTRSRLVAAYVWSFTHAPNAAGGSDASLEADNPTQ